MRKSKIFYGGPIITMNDNIPSVEAVGIEEDKIVAVGSFTDIKEKLPEAELIDLNNHSLLPGFHDCHCHALAYVYFPRFLNLRNTKSYSDFLHNLSEIAKKKKSKEWIIGLSYDEQNFNDEKRLPDKWELDKICPNNPVFIFRNDGHIGIANSMALDFAEINENSVSPEGGEFRRNKKGELNGEITERATRIFRQFAYERLKDENIEDLATEAFQNLAERGITTVHSILNYDITGKSTYQRANEVPLLKSLQHIILQNWYSFIFTGRPKNLEGLRKEPPFNGAMKDTKFKAQAIKLYLDGTLGGCTAWMHDPYTDEPEKKGMCVYNNLEIIYFQMKEAHKLGYQIGVHAIGDKANRVLVDLYKRLLTEFPKKDHRHRIEHASLLTSDVIKDMKELGIIASVQPPFITGDRKLAVSRLGAERCKYTYPIKSLVDAGVLCASGSDSPVEDPDVILGLDALVNRDGFVPEQCISIKDALKTYTINGAYSAFEEDVKGSIEVGKLADLVILDKNPLEVPNNEIKDLRVLETIIRGKTVFKKERS